jgi:hypothetical protein
MRRATVIMLTLLVLGASGDGEARAVRGRPVRCCVMVPDDVGGERPYCFVVNARRARLGRRLCRAIGGTPHAAVVR